MSRELYSRHSAQHRSKHIMDVGILSSWDSARAFDEAPTWGTPPFAPGSIDILKNVFAGVTLVHASAPRPQGVRAMPSCWNLGTSVWATCATLKFTDVHDTLFHQLPYRGAIQV